MSFNGKSSKQTEREETLLVWSHASNPIINDTGETEKTIEELPVSVDLESAPPALALSRSPITP